MTPGEALTALRDTSPLVHCITNYVAMNPAANVLLAAGSSPAMIHAVEEVADFTPLAGALTVNIGTLSPPWAEAMLKAAETAARHQIPWVLDPVAHFATPYRAGIAQDLLALRPTILRGNASEVLALAGEAGAGKGADSGDSVAAAAAAARALAQRSGAVVAVTGPRDFVTDGTRALYVSGGSPLMPQITALGCSLTALMGGYAAVCPPFEAATASLAHFSAAAARAEPLAQGPGSFMVHFLDALAAVTPADLEAVPVT
ncbi:MAG: hydroxyethylthiazole kinase [Pseudomonadota bacterium]